MTLSSGFHMPGAFHADGIHQGLFRPPVSPASSSGYLPTAARPAPAVVDTASTPKRKRNHHQHHHHHHQTPHTASEKASGWPDHDDAPPTATKPSGGVLAPPAPIFTHGHPGVYTLAGEVGTPHAGPDDSSVLGESMYSDSNYRRALGCKRPREDVDMTDPGGPMPLFNLPTEPSQPRGWSSVAFSTLGGVVGKVWEFCKAGAFKGFYAGGGAGYDVQPGDELAPETPQYYDDDKVADEHRVPGYFPQGAGEYHYNEAAEDTYTGYDSRASTPTAPAAKRRHMSAADELGRNWVMVKEPHAGTATPTPRKQTANRSQPRNRNHGPAVTTGRRIAASPRNTPNAGATNPAITTPRRYSSRLSSSAAASTSAQEPPRPASSASLASFRSPEPAKAASRAVPNPAGSASPTHAASTHSRRRSLNQSIGHASFSHRRTHSNASTASSRGGRDQDPIEASPRLDAEAKKLATRRKMEERDADVRIAAFNKRLQDMIRQGKEALGTTVEVDGGDGGWEDDD
ncbi:hypothetical protein VFPFJ_01464 [Purpureocillium lilacinum]|nr:hypothetical protein VFPFJ_01464 [Purpureocillium lilacinum]OAQ95354.1 hypothetical protein VFPFJ_01464 [Purpureocillium lilacinum]GJN80378.1 hypothetical protein PLIIFM63780_003904 [Purpureocillium lilacinum]